MLGIRARAGRWICRWVFRRSNRVAGGDCELESGLIVMRIAPRRAFGPERATAIVYARAPMAHPSIDTFQYMNSSCTILPSATVYSATSSRVARAPVAFGVTSN